MLKISDTSCQKPRKFSRKVFICSCECAVIPNASKNILDKVIVKYEIEYDQDFNYSYTPQKSYWGSYQYWGKFKKIVELPKIFEKLNDNEYTIYTGYFTRDNCQMPCIYKIEILNESKYLNLKKQEERKKKLNTINKK